MGGGRWTVPGYSVSTATKGYSRRKDRIMATSSRTLRAVTWRTRTRGGRGCMAKNGTVPWGGQGLRNGTGTGTGAVWHARRGREEEAMATDLTRTL